MGQEEENADHKTNQQPKFKLLSSKSILKIRSNPKAPNPFNNTNHQQNSFSKTKLKTIRIARRISSNRKGLDGELIREFLNRACDR